MTTIAEFKTRKNVALDATPNTSAGMNNPQFTTTAGQKVLVPKFWLQETASFPEGPPQREEYIFDSSFRKDCLAYEEEWRAGYKCCDSGCRNRDCPEHFPSKRL